MQKKVYDVAVIGTGVSGSTIAHKCAAAGKKTAVIESSEELIGGTCELFGCNPKKVYVTASGVKNEFEALKGKGLSGSAEIDWEKLAEFQHEFTDGIQEKDKKAFEKHAIDVYTQYAHFTGKDTLRTGDTEIKASKIVIASGSTPRKLNIPGEELIKPEHYLYEIKTLPEKIILIGGGYISFEFAHVLASAGAAVEIIEAGEKPLAGFENELVDLLVKAGKERGINVRTNTAVSGVSQDKDGAFIVHTEGAEKTVKAGLVIHGAGRVPNTEKLDLEKGNIQSGPGGIKVNEYMQSVTNENVYAAGDVNDKSYMLTPVAALEGKVISGNIINKEKVSAVYTGIPSAVFTMPALASAGMTEIQVRKAGLEYDVKFKDTSSHAVNRRKNMKYGAYKIITDKKTDRILGVHMLAHNAEETINIFAMAIQTGVTRQRMRDIVWGFPTDAYEINYMLKM
ncbi:MAG: dihydrolipoyl dehydrogenase family protein [Candidatus Goldiibacteriota bacterium]